MKIEKINNLDAIKLNHPHLDTVIDGAIVDDKYRVLIAKTGKYLHIRIRRLDDAPITSFSDMQMIKNLFVGPECTAIQVFPRESDYVNNTNTYHLFSWENMDIPNLKTLYKYAQEKQ